MQESSISTNPAAKGGGSTPTDAELKDLAGLRGNDRTSITSSVELRSHTATLQPTHASDANDSSSTLSCQEERLHAGKTPNGRGELPAVSSMVRHGSFNRGRREYKDDDMSSSAWRVHTGAYAAGRRRFMSNKAPSIHGMLSVDAAEETRGEERGGFWSSPTSQWPGSDSMAGQQAPTYKSGMEGVKERWLAGKQTTAGRHWTADESLEDWKQSLRVLARLREDGDMGASNSTRGGCVAPKGSVRVVRNDPSASPARASAFDLKDAMRWSQQASSHTECSRRSLDDRDLPRSITELRDAIHVRSRLLSSAPSLPLSPRPTSVVARLMGLDDIPKTCPPELARFAHHHHNRKPSGEAKLLQQLLQCSPSTPPAQTSPAPLPPSPILKSPAHGGHRVSAENSVDNLVSSPQYSDFLVPHPGRSLSRLNDCVANDATNHAKLQESMGCAGTTWEDCYPPARSPASRKNQQSLSVAVLKQSEELRSPPPHVTRGFHDEIEHRLRLLGLQSSEQERKTLKQILEAMQAKGLLRPPDNIKLSSEVKQRQASQGSPGISSNVSPVRTPATDGIESWAPPQTKSMTRSESKGIQSAKNDSTASIVIMRPVMKSPSRIASSVDDRGAAKECAVNLSRTEKGTLRKSKKAVNPETNLMKEGAGGRRSKSRASPPLQQSPAPTRKLSLRVRQGQVQVLKGPSQTASFEQARRSGLDFTPVRCQERVPRKSPGKAAKKISETMPNLPENRPFAESNNAHTSDPYRRETIHSTGEHSHPNRIMSPSEATSDSGTLEDSCIKEVVVATPPREAKGEHSFREKRDRLSKLEVVHEQFSPVSVLEAHLSDTEVESSLATESISGLMDFPEDISSCSPAMEAFGFLSQACNHVDTMQPSPQELSQHATIQEDSMVDASARDGNLMELVRKDSMQEAEQACARSPVGVLYTRNAMLDDEACSCAITMSTGEWVESAEQCNRVEEAHANYGFCRHMDATVRRDGDQWMRLDGNACAISMKDDLWADTGNLMHVPREDDLAYNGEVHTSNADFCYARDVLHAAGLTWLWANGEGTVADGWLALGGEMPRELFEELEQRWDAVNAEEEGGYVEAEDRDMGGELYRKSQQASMRRRLVFNCLNEIVGGHLSWLGMPGWFSFGVYCQLPLSQVWLDLQRLEQGPCSAEDSMYAMLEHDLHHDADYSIPRHWSGIPTQLAAVALQLEHDIFDALVSESFPQAPCL